MATLDLIARVNELAAADPGIFDRYFDGHMTPAGNRWVAEEVAAALRRPEPANGGSAGSGRQ